MNLLRYVRTIGLRARSCREHQGLHRPPPEPRDAEGLRRIGWPGAEDDHLVRRRHEALDGGDHRRQRDRLPCRAAGDGGVTRANTFATSSILRHRTAPGRGFVDYVLGAEPGSGAFVVGHCEYPVAAEYLKYFKMGDGPCYVFYTPWHLPQAEAPLTAARAALFEMRP